MGRFRQVKGAGSVLQAKGTACGKALSEGRPLKPVRKRKREQIRSVLQEPWQPQGWGWEEGSRLRVGHDLGGYLSGPGRKQQRHYGDIREWN